MSGCAAEQHRQSRCRDMAEKASPLRMTGAWGCGVQDFMAVAFMGK